MNPYENAAIITAVAFAIFSAFPPEEVALISADLVQLGDTLAAMLARGEFDNEPAQKEKNALFYENGEKPRAL